MAGQHWGLGWVLGSPEIKFEVLICSRAGAARQLPSHSEDEDDGDDDDGGDDDSNND